MRSVHAALVPCSYADAFPARLFNASVRKFIKVGAETAVHVRFGTMLRQAAKEAARLAAVRAAQQYSASTSGLSVIERLTPAALAHQQAWSSRAAGSSDFGVLQISFFFSSFLAILHTANDKSIFIFCG